MANLRYADEAPLSALMRTLRVSLAGQQRIRTLVDGWRSGRDTTADIRRVFVEAAEYCVGEQPEDDRAAVRWRRLLDGYFDDIDHALALMKRGKEERRAS